LETAKTDVRSIITQQIGASKLLIHQPRRVDWISDLTRPNQAGKQPRCGASLRSAECGPKHVFVLGRQ